MSTAANPGKLDGNAHVMKRAWMLRVSNGHVCSVDDRIANAHEVYVVPLRVSATILAGAATFEAAFDRELPTMAFAEAAQQLMFKIVGDLRMSLANSQQSRPGDPCMVHVETVPADQRVVDEEARCEADKIRATDAERSEFFSASAADDEESSSSSSSSISGYKRRRDASSSDSVVFKSPVAEELEDTSTSSFRHGGDPTKREFLRGLQKTALIIEYRLWIHVLEPNVNFAKQLFKVVAENNEYYMQNFTGHSNAADRAKKASSHEENWTTKMHKGALGRQLNDDERWRLIRDDHCWAQVCDMLIGRINVTRPDKLSVVVGRRSTGRDNPAHPFNTLSPAVILALSDRRCDAKQRDIANYYDAQTHVWRWPCPDRVLAVPPPTQNVATFRAKYLPFYQAITRGDNIDYNHFRRHLNTQRSRLAADGPSTAADAAMLFGDELSEDNDDYTAVFGGLEADIEDVLGVDEPPPDAYIAEDGAVPQILAEGNLDALETYDPVVGLGDQDFHDPQSGVLRSLLDPSDSPTRSAFHELRFMGAAQREQLVTDTAADESIPREKLRAELETIRRAMLSLYTERCTTSSADVSRIGRMINAHYEQLKTAQATLDDRLESGDLSPEEQRLLRAAPDMRWLGAKRPLIDSRLSTFGNMVARDMMRLEETMYVSTCHLELYTAMYGSLDAYRHAFDLHFNMLMSGRQATSKSFTIETLQATRIRDTVEIIDRETKQARDQDVDDNDVITCMHEVPREMISPTAKGGDDAREARAKNRLTSMKTSSRIYGESADGKRINRYQYSQCIGTFFGAWNNTKGDVSPAMLTRFYAKDFFEHERPGHSPDMYIGVHQRLDASGRRRHQQMLARSWNEQFLHYHVEKLVAIGVLGDVTMSAFHACSAVIRRHLKRQHLITSHVRTITRVLVLARQLTISRALEYLFSSPASPYYGRPFEFEQLLDLDPLLHDDLEVVLFAFSLMSEEFTGSARVAVMSQLHTLYRPGAARRQMPTANATYTAKQHYYNDNTLVRTADATADALTSLMSNAVAGRRRAAMPSAVGAPPDYAVATMPTTELRAGDDAGTDPQRYFAYLHVKKSVALAARDIATALSESEMRMDAVEVARSLTSALHTTIRGRRYQWDEAFQRPLPLESVEREPMQGGFENGPNEFFIHLDLLSPDSDPLETALRQCYTRFGRTTVVDPVTKKTRPAPMTLVDARQVSAKYPHLLRTRTFDPLEDGHHQMVRDVTLRITAQTDAAYPEMVPGVAAGEDAAAALSIATVLASKAVVLGDDLPDEDEDPAAVEPDDDALDDDGDAKPVREPYDTDESYLARCNDQRMHAGNSLLTSTGGGKTQRSRAHRLRMSFAEMSARDRSRRLFLDEDRAASYGGACDFEVFEAAARLPVATGEQPPVPGCGARGAYVMNARFVYPYSFMAPADAHKMMPRERVVSAQRADIDVNDEAMAKLAAALSVKMTVSLPASMTNLLKKPRVDAQRRMSPQMCADTMLSASMS